MKKESLKKDLLTREKCLQDLLIPKEKLSEKRWWPLLLVQIPIGLVYVSIAVFATEAMVRVVLLSIFGGVMLLLGITCAIDALHTRRKNRKIRESSFHIEQDLLVKSAQDAYYHFPTRFDNGLRDRLDFSGHGSFFLKGGTFYNWSENYYMSSEGIFNTAIVGDTFYLLVYDDDPERKPVMVYNAKFFDYDRELWENR